MGRTAVTASLSPGSRWRSIGITRRARCRLGRGAGHGQRRVSGRFGTRCIQSSLDGVALAFGRAVAQQLRAVLELQRQAGRRRFLIGATTETSVEVAAVRNAIAVDQLDSVLLTVSPEVAAARISAREPDAWPGKRRLITHTRDLAVSMRNLAGIDIRIDTDGREAGDVAVELRAALRPYGLTV